MWTQLNYNGKLMDYEICDDGTVVSKRTNKVVAQYDHPNGYVTISLYDSEAKKSYIALLHRVMLMSFNFIPNYKEKEVNHVDGNKKNNSLSNLEWCTKSENANHAYKTGLNTKAKIVYQYDNNGILIGTYYSVLDAERQTGIRESLISGQINGAYKSAGGYRWSYEPIQMPVIDKVKQYKRSVLQKNKNTFEVIAEYESATEASRVTGIQQSDITRVCQGKRKTAGGFCWSYKNQS